jgi:hypothetical protein
MAVREVDGLSTVIEIQRRVVNTAGGTMRSPVRFSGGVRRNARAISSDEGST